MSSSWCMGKGFGTAASGKPRDWRDRLGTRQRGWRQEQAVEQRRQGCQEGGIAWAAGEHTAWFWKGTGNRMATDPPGRDIGEVDVMAGIAGPAARCRGLGVPPFGGRALLASLPKPPCRPRVPACDPRSGRHGVLALRVTIPHAPATPIQATKGKVDDRRWRTGRPLGSARLMPA